MVEFELNEEQKALCQTVHVFAENEIRPIAAEIDRSMSDEFPIEVVRKAAKLGFTTLIIPEKYGGAGLSDLELVLLCEELAWGDAGLASTIGGSNGLGVKPILFAGTEAQKEKWLGMICERAEEPFLTAFCATEASGGSDVISEDPRAGIQTVAQKEGSDYVLNGTKTFVTNGGVAGLYVVFAKTDINKGASAGLSCFIVPADTPGVSVGERFDKMGQRLSPTTELILDNVRVPADNLLGEEGDGIYIAINFLTGGGSAVGAFAVGLARAAYEEARKYALERVQGGVPIIDHQAIGFKLADMCMQIEAARLLTWKSAWANQVDPDSRIAAMTKVYCSEMVQKVTYDAVQIFGGYGYMRDYPVEKYMRDARLLPLYDLTNELLRALSIVPFIAMKP